MFTIINGFKKYIILLLVDKLMAKIVTNRINSLRRQIVILMENGGVR